MDRYPVIGRHHSGVPISECGLLLVDIFLPHERPRLRGARAFAEYMQFPAIR